MSCRSSRPRSRTTNAPTSVGKSRLFERGDQLEWRADGSPGVQGTVTTSTETDDLFVSVRTGDGSHFAWPVGDKRLRYAQTPNYDDESTTPSMTTIEDIENLTLPGGFDTTKGKK